MHGKWMFWCRMTGPGQLQRNMQLPNLLVCCSQSRAGLCATGAALRLTTLQRKGPLVEAVNEVDGPAKRVEPLLRGQDRCCSDNGKCWHCATSS